MYRMLCWKNPQFSCLSRDGTDFESLGNLLSACWYPTVAFDTEAGDYLLIIPDGAEHTIRRYKTEDAAVAAMML